MPTELLCGRMAPRRESSPVRCTRYLLVWPAGADWIGSKEKAATSNENPNIYCLFLKFVVLIVPPVRRPTGTCNSLPESITQLLPAEDQNGRRCVRNVLCRKPEHNIWLTSGKCVLFSLDKMYEDAHDSHVRAKLVVISDGTRRYVMGQKTLVSCITFSSL